MLEEQDIGIKMRRVALTLAALTFFVMAFVGMAMGLSPLSTTIRALVGAVVAFLAASVAIRLALDVLVKAVMGVNNGRAVSNQPEDEQESESQQK
jgi:hypothetical protein